MSEVKTKKKMSMVKKQDFYSFESIKKILEDKFVPKFKLEKDRKEWIMRNRVKFNQWLDVKFRSFYNDSTTDNKQSCTDIKRESVELFPHQKFVKDYIQFNSPYRGILLYHGLGVGKSCSSIAAAELLMNNMDVIIMLPASLKNNYINEIKKCGKEFYNINQYWYYVPNDKFEPSEFNELTELLNLKEEYLSKKKFKGLWIPHDNPENLESFKKFSELDVVQQKQIIEQIDAVIENNYEFINYNGLSIKKINQLKEKGNPFNNKCVVIDEVHNMISTMVNKRAIGTTLYKLLYTAENCKLIMLSGTPIINYPYEVAYIINLIVGPMKYNTIKLYNKVNHDLLYDKLSSIKNIDDLSINLNNNKIEFSLLPVHFEYVEKNKLLIQRKKLQEDIVDKIHKILDKNKIRYDKTITEKEAKCLPEDEDEFNSKFIDVINNEFINKLMFTKRILGTISHYSTYSPELYPEWNVKEIIIDMSDRQFEEYISSRITEIQKDKNIKKVQNKNSLFKDKGQVYRFYSRANCNFVFPKNIPRPYPKSNFIKKLKEIDNFNDSQSSKSAGAKDKELDTVSKNILAEKKKEYEKSVEKALDQINKTKYLSLENVKEYSPKFYKIVKKINNLNGTALVYSQFRKVEGLGLLGLTLNNNGYAQFKIKKENGEWVTDIEEEDWEKPKYMTFDGNTEETQILLKIFNSDIKNIPAKIKETLGHKNNIHGDLIKILMITQSGAEGISLKNVRQVHVIEPYWNYIRIDQVIGRAVRTCSHIDLPKEDRNVTVYIYNMKFSNEQVKKLDKQQVGIVDKFITTDQHIYELAKNKAKIINSLLDAVKSASIDCSLNNTDSNLRCFTFPRGSNQKELSYHFDIKNDLLDEQYLGILKKDEWKGKLLKTKKGNFIVKDDNSVYDYNIYNKNKTLVKLGTLKIINGKKTIIED